MASSLVIAEVNRHMPWTAGPSVIGVDAVAMGPLRAFVEDAEGILHRVHVIGDIAIGEIAAFDPVAEVIHYQDIVDTPLIEALDEIAADKAGATGDYVH